MEWDYTNQDELVEDLIRVTVELGHRPAFEEYSEHGKWSGTTVRNHFKTYQRGKDKIPYKYWADGTPPGTKLLFEDLREVAESLGHPPSQEEYSNHSKFGRNWFETRQSSWDEILVEAGLKDPPENHDPHPSWSPTILSRDNHTCQDCGKVGGKLHAHHILPKSEYPEFKNMIWNGVALCVTCHAERHSDDNCHYVIQWHVEEKLSVALRRRENRLKEMGGPYFLRERDTVPFKRDPDTEPIV